MTPEIEAGMHDNPPTHNSSQLASFHLETSIDRKLKTKLNPKNGEMNQDGMKILRDVLDEIQHHIIIPPLSTNDANGVDGVFPSFLCGVPSFPRFQPAVPR